MHLARREMQIGVEEWLRVIPDFELATDEELIERGGGSMMALKHLRLRLGGGGMKLLIDDDVCMGHGRCYRLAPDVLACDDEGYVTPRGEPIEFPADQHGAAEEIVGYLPRAGDLLIDD